MLKTTQLIKANTGGFPECGYYLPLLSKARRNAKSHPDICIEICKSTLEGVGKMIVLGLDPTVTKAEIDKKDADQIVKLAATQLRQNDDVVENAFVTRATSLTNALAALRNTRSDIGHGREAPKPESSTEEFGRFCLQMTDAIASYMLGSYFRIQTQRLTTAATVVQVPPPSDTGLERDDVEEVDADENRIEYDDFPGFNEHLDARNPLPGKLLYSEALHRLYYEDYRIELGQYLDDLIEEIAPSPEPDAS